MELRSHFALRRTSLAILAAAVVPLALAAQAPKDPVFPPPGDPTPQKPAFPPRTYDCRFTQVPPEIDGRLDDAAWARAPWTEEFIDIQGPALPKPRYRTRARMLWDDRHLYVAAELEEPHVWGTLRRHDEIVFHDNDFEIFIDPNGDAAEYYEIEINVLETVFDLYLHRRYKEGGPADHGWNAEGLRSKVAIEGTVNDPTDVDRRWTLEWAIPWSALRPPEPPKPTSDKTSPEAAPLPPGLGEKERAAAAPKPGEEWRINFSRVQWTHVWEGKTAPKPPSKPINDHFRQEPPKPGEGAPPAYEKVKGRPEDNWVWSPQWQIDMHDPRWWGRVRFIR